MAETTEIAWCDATWSPWEGCQKVGPGCDHCYAEARNKRFAAGANWGPGAPRRRTVDWSKPRLWNRAAGQAGRRMKVFPSLCDPFDNAVPVEWRLAFFQLIAATPHLDWLLLTKRIGNVAGMLGDWKTVPLLPNIWLGATVVTQAEADRDIPKLLAVPARVRFLSVEPMLEQMDITPFLWGKHAAVDLVCQNCPRDADCECGYHTREALKLPSLSWVICGGESGPHARPMHPDWARSLRDQCHAAGVPFTFKQWGCWRAAAWFDGPDADADAGDDFVDLDRVGHVFLANDGRTWDTNGGRLMYPPLPLGHWCLMVNEGKKAAGRVLDGRTHDEFPEVPQ
ncbi:MAG: phage Gp37/Gp68 family protein [Aquincola tertiaricarbonis]